MTKRKFYRTNEFIKLQNEWYKKLDQSGFKDLEWLDTKTGAGHDTPYLETKKSPNSQHLANIYDFTVLKRFENFRFFLANGPFYSNLRDKYLKSRETRCSYPTFGVFLMNQPQYFTKPQEELFRLFCDGLTVREISSELKRLKRLKRLGRLPKRLNRKNSFSIFYVHYHLKILKHAAMLWLSKNAQAGEDDEAGEDYLDHLGFGDPWGSI